MNSFFWQNKVNTEGGYFIGMTGKKLFGNCGKLSGYHTVTLKKNEGGFEALLLSRAIWMAANHKRVPKHQQICHLNHNTGDNRICNLLADSAKNNVLQSVQNRKGTRKRDSYRTEVVAIYPDGKRKQFKSLTECAKELNVSRPVIGKILSNDPLHKYYHYAYNPDNEKYQFVRVS